MAFFIATHPSLLPFLTALIGTGGFTVGIYSFINPSAAARIYGIPVHDSVNQYSLSAILGTGKAPNVKANAATQPSGEGLSLIHALGARNFTAGLTVLSLTSYWHFYLAAGLASSIVRRAVQHALGIVILIGALVPIVDAWVCLQRSRDLRTSRVAIHKHETKSGSDEKGPWEGHDLEYEAYVTGRKAGMLHATRSLVWVAGGVWCLLE